MLGELLHLRLLAPRYDVRSRDAMDPEGLSSSVDRLLFGVDEVKLYEALMPLRSRDQVGYLVEAGVGGGVDRGAHDEDLGRLELVALDLR